MAMTESFKHLPRSWLSGCLIWKSILVSILIIWFQASLRYVFLEYHNIEWSSSLFKRWHKNTLLELSLVSIDFKKCLRHLYGNSHYFSRSITWSLSGLAMVVSKLMNEVASAIFKRNLQSCKFLFTKMMYLQQANDIFAWAEAFKIT